MSKNWCQGFCGLCGTGCGEYCDDLYELRMEQKRLLALMEDILAISDSPGNCHPLMRADLIAIHKQALKALKPNG